MTNENDIYEMEYFDLSGDKKIREKRLTIFIAVFAVMFIWGLWLHLRPGIFVNDVFYAKLGNGVYASGKNRVEVTKKDENEVVVEGCLDGNDFITRLTWEDMDSHVVQKKITIRFDGKSYIGTWTELSWKDSADLSLDYTGIDFEGKDMTTIVGDMMEFELYEEEAYLTCAIVFGNDVSRSNIMGFLFDCLMYIIGIIMYKIPDELYEKLSEPWGYNSDANVQFGTVIKYIRSYALIIIGGISMSMTLFKLMS